MVPVRLLDSSSGWSRFASCLGGELLSWGLASCWLAGCLLCTGHLAFSVEVFDCFCAQGCVKVCEEFRIQTPEPNSGAFELIGRADAGLWRRTIRGFRTPQFDTISENFKQQLHNLRTVFPKRYSLNNLLKTSSKEQHVWTRQGRQGARWAWFQQSYLLPLYYLSCCDTS